METMHFHIAETNLFFRTTLFCIKGVSMNNLANTRNCPGVEGRLHWMPEYERVL